MLEDGEGIEGVADAIAEDAEQKNVKSLLNIWRMPDRHNQDGEFLPSTLERMPYVGRLRPGLWTLRTNRPHF